MRVAVLIASYSRPEILSDTLESVLKQTRKPDGVYLALCDPSHALPKWHQDSRVTVHQTGRGQCLQLNTVIKEIADQYDVIAFFDDDSELDPLYLENALHAFSEKDVLSLTGSPAADGNITREEAIELLAKDEEAKRLPKDYYDNNGHWQLYGCNMMIACSALKQELFDERLPDSGYMNDLDTVFEWEDSAGRFVTMVAEWFTFKSLDGAPQGNASAMPKSPLPTTSTTKVSSATKNFVR